MQKFVLIDSNAIVHRAFHALPHMSTKSGETTNAVYGFSMILLNMLRDLKPDYIAATFDIPKPTFRHKEYAEYKAKRVKAPDELYNQIPRVKEVIDALGIPIYEKEGFEADDLIASLKLKIKNLKLKIPETIIVTGDLDTLQLVDENTKIYTMRKGLTDNVIYDEKAFRERFGFEPKYFADYKGLRGDPSDNIPGVAGIGEKTAKDLIQKYQTIENVYKNLDKIQGRIHDILVEHEKDAQFSKKLSQLVENVKIKFDLDECQFGKFDRQKLVIIFQNLEFKSLLPKIPQKQDSSLFQAQPQLLDLDNRPKDIKKLEGNYKIITDTIELTKLAKFLQNSKESVIDTETDFLGGKLIGISFAIKHGQAFYIPVDHKNIEQLPKNQVLKELKPILEDKKIAKIGHNLKYDATILHNEGINLQPIAFDTMIASYLSNPTSRLHNLDQVAFVELGYEKIPLAELIGGKKLGDLSEAPLEKVAEYSCEDADITLRLKKHFEKELKKQGLQHLFYNLEMPLVPILGQMEEIGVKLDVNYLVNMQKKVKKQINNLKEQIYKLAGETFNISSTQQLRHILFEKLQLSTEEIKRTKTGYSTAATELEKMRGKHKIIDAIFEHRELVKLANTYIDTLPSMVDQNNRLHTSFNQTVTATGRLSSTDPNLQNIPIRTELGSQIRRAFVADEGFNLLSADYSQIELRVIAYISGDKKMKEAFLRGEDIHAATASYIFAIPINKITKSMRRIAKTINFGVIYGMSPYGMAQRVEGVDQSMAKKFIDRYFETFQGMKKYIEDIKEVAAKVGYVETLLGRRRYLPEIYSSMAQVRGAAERMAINMPIQGTAADIMKMAMIEVNSKIKIPAKGPLRLRSEASEARRRRQKSKFRNEEIRLLLQVHDELVFEVKKGLEEKWAEIICDTMEKVFKLSVPLKVDVSVGENWRDLEKIT